LFLGIAFSNKNQTFVSLRLCDKIFFHEYKNINMTEDELSKIIVDISYKIHTRLGPGLLESVYEAILYHEIIKKGLKVERQKPIPVIWDNVYLDIGFRSDLIIENKVIVEIKSVEKLSNAHLKQLLTYIKITNLKLGLLINFNEALIKNGIKRVVYGL
jgi:GxxExxY protein